MLAEDFFPGTICGVLREIYQKSSTDEVKLLARIATTMAKKMSRKLLIYHKKLGERNALD